MRLIRQRQARLGLLLLTLSVCGCLGLRSNPSYFPFLLPGGDIERTHAKPRGKGYFADFDPHAHKLVVRPVESCGPVQGHHVLIATVYDVNGQPRRARRVEWMLEGAGQIVEVDESGYTAGRGAKVDNNYAVSYTDFKEHRITRGNDDPLDDFVIRPGQTWCVITSSVEGDTHVTAYAPGIYDWRENKVHITHHWVNAHWTFPASSECRYGEGKELTTQVFRPSDKQPLAGYHVRYRILDEGSDVVFARGGRKETIRTSGIDGRAAVKLVQRKPREGVTKVAVEVVRAANGPGVVLGKGEVRVDWVAPQLRLKMDGPRRAPLNEKVRYNLRIRNNGRADAKSMTVRGNVPEGAEHIASEPPAIIENGRMIWDLGSLGAGKERELTVEFKTTQAGVIRPRFQLTGDDGQHSEADFETQVTRSDLGLKLLGPKTAAVGSPVTFRIQITNPGTGPTDRIKLKATFDPALEHEQKANPLDFDLERPIAPGESRTIPLVLTPRQKGNFKVRVEALGADQLRAEDTLTIEARFPQLRLRLNGPRDRLLNRPSTWDIEVVNEGKVPLSNVMVRDPLPPELNFVDATEGGSLDGREVVWSIGSLDVGESRKVSLTTVGNKVTTRGRHRVSVTGVPDSKDRVTLVSAQRITAENEIPFTVRGIPAFDLKVADTPDPAAVGRRITYRIEVANQGSIAGNQVAIKATLPEHVRFLRATGPTSHTVSGGEIRFKPRDNLEPDRAWTYQIEVEAVKEGDARLKIELTGDGLSKPVRSEESTRIVVRSP